MGLEPVRQYGEERSRVAVCGRLLSEGGGPCTLLAVHYRNKWVLYPHGVHTLAVELSEDDIATLARGLQRDAQG
ncbi:MAG: hypothetical protein ACRDRY_05365 [Pseudonocardiaceae bacterium]